MKLYIFYSLTATQTLTFEYVKYTPDFSFTGSFLDIVSGQYIRLGMGEKNSTKNKQRVRRCQFLLVNIARDVMSVL